MEIFGTTPPCTTYEEKPILDPSGKAVPGLFSAWITLNQIRPSTTPYTTEMVKGVIAGFHRAQESPQCRRRGFYRCGNMAFCTGGNTKEYGRVLLHTNPLNMPNT